MPDADTVALNGPIVVPLGKQGAKTLKILIVGAAEVGFHIANHLVLENKASEMKSCESLLDPIFTAC